MKLFKMIYKRGKASECFEERYAAGQFFLMDLL